MGTDFLNLLENKGAYKKYILKTLCCCYDTPVRIDCVNVFLNNIL